MELEDEVLVGDEELELRERVLLAPVLVLLAAVLDGRAVLVLLALADSAELLVKLRLLSRVPLVKVPFEKQVKLVRLTLVRLAYWVLLLATSEQLKVRVELLASVELPERSVEVLFRDESLIKPKVLLRA